MKRLHHIRDSINEMRTCHEMGQWLQHYLDGELDQPTADQVHEHLLTCVRCGMEFDTYRRIVDVLHEGPPDSGAVIDDQAAIERLRDFATRLTSHDGTSDVNA